MRQAGQELELELELERVEKVAVAATGTSQTRNQFSLAGASSRTVGPSGPIPEHRGKWWDLAEIASYPKRPSATNKTPKRPTWCCVAETSMRENLRPLPQYSLLMIDDALLRLKGESWTGRDSQRSN